MPKLRQISLFLLLLSCYFSAASTTSASKPVSSPWVDGRYCACRNDRIWLDVVFLVEASASMGRRGVDDVAAFMQGVLYQLSKGDERFRTRAGIIAYGANSTVVARFSDLLTDDDVDRIEIPYLGGTKTNIESGIRRANELLSEESKKRRAQRVIVLVATAFRPGLPNDPQQIAESFRDSGGTIITLDYIEKDGIAAPKLALLATPSYAYRSTDNGNTFGANDLLRAFCDVNCFCSTNQHPFVMPEVSLRPGLPTGGCYEVVTLATVERAARIDCRRKKAALPSIHSDHKQEFLTSLFPQETAQWIGLERQGESRSWIDQSPFDYSNWPRDADVMGPAFYSQQYAGTETGWFSSPPTKSAQYTCQFAPCDALNDDCLYSEWPATLPTESTTSNSQSTTTVWRAATEIFVPRKILVVADYKLNEDAEDYCAPGKVQGKHSEGVVHFFVDHIYAFYGFYGEDDFFIQGYSEHDGFLAMERKTDANCFLRDSYMKNGALLHNSLKSLTVEVPDILLIYYAEDDCNELRLEQLPFRSLGIGVFGANMTDSRATCSIDDVELTDSSSPKYLPSETTACILKRILDAPEYREITSDDCQRFYTECGFHQVSAPTTQTATTEGTSMATLTSAVRRRILVVADYKLDEEAVDYCYTGKLQGKHSEEVIRSFVGQTFAFCGFDGENEIFIDGYSDYGSFVTKEKSTNIDCLLQDSYTKNGSLLRDGLKSLSIYVPDILLIYYAEDDSNELRLEQLSYRSLGIGVFGANMTDAKSTCSIDDVELADSSSPKYLPSEATACILQRILEAPEYKEITTNDCERIYIECGFHPVSAPPTTQTATTGGTLMATLTSAIRRRILVVADYKLDEEAADHCEPGIVQGKHAEDVMRYFADQTYSFDSFFGEEMFINEYSNYDGFLAMEGSANVNCFLAEYYSKNGALLHKVLKSLSRDDPDILLIYYAEDDSHELQLEELPFRSLGIGVFGANMTDAKATCSIDDAELVDSSSPKYLPSEATACILKRILDAPEYNEITTNDCQRMYTECGFHPVSAPTTQTATTGTSMVTLTSSAGRRILVVADYKLDDEDDDYCMPGKVQGKHSSDVVRNIYGSAFTFRDFFGEYLLIQDYAEYEIFVALVKAANTNCFLGYSYTKDGALLHKMLKSLNYEAPDILLIYYAEDDSAELRLDLLPFKSFGIGLWGANMTDARATCSLDDVELVDVSSSRYLPSEATACILKRILYDHGKTTKEDCQQFYSDCGVHLPSSSFPSTEKKPSNLQQTRQLIQL